MKKNDLIILLSSILIFVCLWIGFNIYHNSISSTISPSVDMQITPISPNFDTKIIDELKKREIVNPVFQLSPSVATSPVVETPQTISSGSAQQATSGGSLLQ